MEKYINCILYHKVDHNIVKSDKWFIEFKYLSSKLQTSLAHLNLASSKIYLKFLFTFLFTNGLI